MESQGVIVAEELVTVLTRRGWSFKGYKSGMYYFKDPLGNAVSFPEAQDEPGEILTAIVMKRVGNSYDDLERLSYRPLTDEGLAQMQEMDHVDILMEADDSQNAVTKTFFGALSLLRFLKDGGEYGFETVGQEVAV